MKSKAIPVFLTLLALCATVVLGGSLAAADDTGPLSPTAASNFTFAGNGIWTQSGASLLADVAASDDARASVSVVTGTSDYLVLSFPVSIPTDATVDGLRLDIEGQKGGSAPTVSWVTLASPSGTGGLPGFYQPSNANPVVFSGPSDTVVTDGGSTDNWSGLTAADVNSGSFVVAMRAFTGAGSDTMQLDTATLTVFYTPALPAAAPWSMALTVAMVLGAVLFTKFRLRRRNGLAE